MKENTHTWFKILGFFLVFTITFGAVMFLSKELSNMMALSIPGPYIVRTHAPDGVLILHESGWQADADFFIQEKMDDIMAMSRKDPGSLIVKYGNSMDLEYMYLRKGTSGFHRHVRSISSEIGISEINFSVSRSELSGGGKEITYYFKRNIFWLVAIISMSVVFSAFAIYSVVRICRLGNQLREID